MKGRLLLVKVPDKWDGQRCGICCECPLLYWVRKASGNAHSECPLATAKPVVEVHGWSEICDADKLYTVREV